MKFCLKLLVLILLTTVISCTGQNSKSINSVEAKAFSEKIATTPNAQLIDVRTPDEFNPDHIEKAINIDWLSDNFVSSVAKLDKSKTVFVYCKSSGRSFKAAAKLEELGFKKIYVLEGGIMKWNAAGLSKSSPEKIGMTTKQYGELINSDKKILINFNAKWCEPCRKMAPFMERLQKDLADKVIIIRLDADENKTLLNEIKINELPTLLLYVNKEIKWKHSGYISEENLKKQLQ